MKDEKGEASYPAAEAAKAVSPIDTAVAAANTARRVSLSVIGGPPI